MRIKVMISIYGTRSFSKKKNMEPEGHLREDFLVAIGTC